MIEEVNKNLFRIEIPLPHNPLKSLNSYLIKGDGRFVLIDTGMNRQECLDAMTTALKKLEVDLTKTDFFITHVHSDHLGLAATLLTPSSKIYFNEIEAKILDVPQEELNAYWQLISDKFAQFGFPAAETEGALSRHPGRRYSGNAKLPYTYVKEGDLISIGDYFLRCIETPGHSPCHCCLYDEQKKILFAGDHILFDITPNISYWVELENSLKHYLINLDRVAKMDVQLLLPGHRRLLNNHRRRIEELKAHHSERLNEIMTQLEEGEKSVYEITPFITWDIKCDSFDDLPPQQKWFAFGETLAHVLYLEAEGKIKGHAHNGKIKFSRVS